LCYSPPEHRAPLPPRELSSSVLTRCNIPTTNPFPSERFREVVKVVFPQPLYFLRDAATPGYALQLFCNFSGTKKARQHGNTKTERPRLAQLRAAGHSPRPFGSARALSFRAERPKVPARSEGICFFFRLGPYTGHAEPANTDHAAFAAALSNFSPISPNEKERGTAKRRNYYGPLATHSTLPGHSDHQTRNTRARTTEHAAFAPDPTSAEAPDTPAICLWRCPPV
jgi:hypothetical protein